MTKRLQKVEKLGYFKVAILLIRSVWRVGNSSKCLKIGYYHLGDKQVIKICLVKLLLKGSFHEGIFKAAKLNKILNPIIFHEAKSKKTRYLIADIVPAIDYKGILKFLVRLSQVSNDQIQS